MAAVLGGVLLLSNAAWAAGCSIPIFGQPRQLNLDIVGTVYGAAIGDFNNDGRTDLAVTSPAGIGILFGTGQGGFSAPQTVLTNVCDTLLVADLNGDGKLDLLARGESGSGWWLFLGNGNGAFASQAIALDTSYLIAEALSDLNHDGKPDLALITTDGLRVSLNRGDGSFGPAVTYSLSPGLHRGPGGQRLQQ